MVLDTLNHLCEPLRESPGRLIAQEFRLRVLHFTWALQPRKGFLGAQENTSQLL